SVNTATVTAGVRGTEFDVSIREDGEVLINVEEGEIETEVDGERHTITRGNASTFSIIEARRDFKGRVDRTKWRQQALDKLRENPALFIKKMLERERLIIARLKQNQTRMEQYRKDFVIFLKKVQYLEQRKMYRQERALIIQQIEKTRKAIGFFIIVRRQLAGIRSFIVIAARLEQRLDPETVKQLPSLQELKREYQRITYVIVKINEADRKLRRVLFMLNRKLDELNRKIEAGN
ncbi:MAG: FecR domain-containing protein, partial [Spirochaetota bacterium]